LDNLDVDITGVAQAYGLLRLPRMDELKGRKDVQFHVPLVGINTASIAYKNPRLELERQEQIKQRQNKELPSRQIGQNNKPSNKRKSEWQELQDEERLIKKLKKGKISKEEFNKALEHI
jgi:ATP-dependent RNA helicase DDX55/SPB4